MLFTPDVDAAFYTTTAGDLSCPTFMPRSQVGVEPGIAYTSFEELVGSCQQQGIHFA